MTVALANEPIRVSDADDSTKLQTIAASGAAEIGAVVALDFAAIRTAMGDRWPRRCSDVRSRIERAIDGRAGETALAVRIGDCEYLLCFLDQRGAVAQAGAFRIMEELLTHFLGRCAPQDLIVKRVSSMTADSLEMTPLVRDEVERARAVEEGEAPAAPPRQPRTTALIEGPAERLSLKFVAQEMLHIASGVQVGTRLRTDLHNLNQDRPVEWAEELNLSITSLLQINLLGIEQVRGMMEASTRASVFVLPLSLKTMIGSRARAAVLAELAALRTLDQRRLIIELTGMERGTPSSRLMEAAWQLKPFCRAVNGRTLLERTGLRSLSDARLSGVHVSARDLGLRPAQVAAGLLAAGQSARALAPMVMAVDLADAQLVGVCSVAGFTHAALEPGAWRTDPPAADPARPQG